MSLTRAREARREPAMLDPYAEDPVRIEAQGLGPYGLRRAVGQIELPGLRTVSHDPEGHVLNLDLTTEAADLHDEDTLILRKANSPQQGAVQTRMRDHHTLVDEGRVPAQPQTRGLQRRRRAQRVSCSVLPSLCSSSAPRKS